MASSEAIDFEEDYLYLFHGGHVWTLVRSGVNRHHQDWQAYRCGVCKLGYVTVQGILRPPGWEPLMPPKTGCKGPPTRPS